MLESLARIRRNRSLLFSKIWHGSPSVMNPVLKYNCHAENLCQNWVPSMDKKITRKGGRGYLGIVLLLRSPAIKISCMAAEG